MSAAQWCELRPVTVREAERMQDPRYQESLFLQREQTLRDFKVHLVFFTDAMIWLRWHVVVRVMFWEVSGSRDVN